MKRAGLLIAAAAALGLAAGAQAADKLKVGFVYVGPIGDHGWTYRHDVGAWRSKRRWATRSRRPMSRA